MLKNISFHNIANVSMDDVRELTGSDGETYFARRITFVDDQDRDFTVSFFSDSFENLSVSM